MLYHSLQTRHSIEAIHKVIQTGDRPVLVSADDFEDYVCKYRYPERQFNELLAWGFLKQWTVPIPDAAFVQVQPNHIPEVFWREGVRPSFFEKACFGSLHLPHVREIDNFLTALGANRNDVRKIQNRVDLLKIALFDLWMTNEDRNGNNYNLLLRPVESGKFFIYAIDHGACFNSGHVGQPFGLSSLTEDDSLLSTDICRLLYANSHALTNDAELVLSQFRQNVALCSRSVLKILNFASSFWQTDTAQRQEWLQKNLFAPAWLEEVETTFRHYLQTFLR